MFKTICSFLLKKNGKDKLEVFVSIIKDYFIIKKGYNLKYCTTVESFFYPVTIIVPLSYHDIPKVRPKNIRRVLSVMLNRVLFRNFFNAFKKISK